MWRCQNESLCEVKHLSEVDDANNFEFDRSLFTLTYPCLNYDVRLLTGVSCVGNFSCEVQERYEPISLNARR